METAAQARARGWHRLLPVAGLLLLAPLCAEYVAAYDDSTGDPVALLTGLLFLAPLYGMPALLIRELARRFRLGWPGILLLAAAFGLVEAGLVDQSMFSTSYRDIDYWDEITQPTFIDVLGLSGYTTVAFVGGHLMLTIGAPIAIVETLSGRQGTQPWLGWQGLAVAVLAWLGMSALILTDHLRTESDHASTGQIVGTIVVVLALVVTAVVLARRQPVHVPMGSAMRAEWLAVIAVLGVAAFHLMPPPWLGTVAAAAILAGLGGLMIHQSRRTGWGQRHVVAAAAGPLLAAATLAYLSKPLGDVSKVAQYAHNTFFLLGALALLWWAWRRAGSVGEIAVSRTSRPRSPRRAAGR